MSQNFLRAVIMKNSAGNCFRIYICLEDELKVAEMDCPQ